MSEDIFGCHNSGRYCWHLAVEARGAAKHPAVHKVTPTAENYLAQSSISQG